MRQNPGDTLYNLTVTVNVAGMEVVELIGPADADRPSIAGETPLGRRPNDEPLRAPLTTAKSQQVGACTQPTIPDQARNTDLRLLTRE